MNLSEHRRIRLVTMCVLYLAQGVPWGFVVITLQAILAERGLSTAEIGGVMALSGLPWAFKWAWGPIIDRYQFVAMGRRRPWIIGAQALMAATMGTMIAMPDLATNVTLLGWIVFIHNCFNALQDVAVDALAVDLLDEQERAFANGLMYGSKYLGGAIGGAGLMTVVAYSGLRTALVLQTALLLLIMLFPLLLRERPGDRLLPWSRDEGGTTSETERISSVVALFGNLFRAFSLKSTLFAAALAIFAHLSSGLLSTVMSVFFIQELGWKAESYAQINGGPGLVVGLAGSVVGGWLADRLGHKRMIALGAVAAAGLYMAFGLAEPYWHHDAVPTAYLLLEPLFVSIVSVSMFALFMDVSWPRVAATQFTAYMALMNLSTTLGHRLAGPIDELLTYSGVFIAAGVFQLIVLGLLLPIDPHQTRRVLA